MQVIFVRHMLLGVSVVTIAMPKRVVLILGNLRARDFRYDYRNTHASIVGGSVAK